MYERNVESNDSDKSVGVMRNRTWECLTTGSNEKKGVRVVAKVSGAEKAWE